MNYTLLTILFTLIMSVSALYMMIYVKKRKINRHREIGYKIVFTFIYFLLIIPTIFLMITG